MYVIKIIIQTIFFNAAISDLEIDIFYLIISLSIEFCWYRAFFSMNFKNLISDFINLTSILTRSFLVCSEGLFAIVYWKSMKYKNYQVLNMWLYYCNFLTYGIISIVLNWAIVFVCWERGLAWYDSAFGTQRSRVRISPLPYFLNFKGLAMLRIEY